VVLLLPPFYSSPGFLSLGSVLFLFSLSGSAGVGSVGGGGMAVLDGGGRMAVLAVDGDARRRFCPFSALCFFCVFLLLPISVSCSSVSSSSFFLLEDGSRWSCCGATGRNGGGGYADHSWWFFLSSPLFGFSLLCFQMLSVFSPFKTIPPPLTLLFASLIHQNFAPPFVL
jgi:hypothetical protein